MSVILSIKPKWAEKILSGEKQIELRKKLWNNKRKIKRAYLYVSSPIKKLVGFIDIENILKERIEFLWLYTKYFSCLSKQEFDEYFSGHSHGSCIVIKEAKRFRNPIDPKEIIPDFRPPQNFCYISKELDKKLMKIEVYFMTKEKWNFKDVWDKELPNLGEKNRKKLKITGRASIRMKLGLFYTNKEFEKIKKKCD